MMSDGAVKTEIDFVVGFDRTTPPFIMVRDAGLVHRTGIIQHTYRADSVDSYFDTALWKRLVDFAVGFGVVSIIARPWAGPNAPNRDWHSGKATQPSAADEVPLANFLESWSEQGPPEFIIARNDGLVLSIATEYWTQVGGPRPYADSYTYSICSRDDQCEQIVSFLRASPDAAGWALSSEIFRANA
jgi:hypothetical protein